MIRMFMYPQLITSADHLVLEPGAAPMQLSEDKVLIWIDLLPAYRYAHPTRTVLVGAESVDIIEGQWWIELGGRRFPDDDAATPGVVAPIAVGKARIHVLPRVFAAGEILGDGRQTNIEISEPSVVLWIDRMPAAKFAHPTRYVILGAHQARVVDGQWWPEIDGRRIDGQILPLAWPQPWEIGDAARPTAPPPGEPKPVGEVILTDVMPVRVARDRGVVTAIGRVPTAGWTDARLDPRVHVVAPGDDIVDFDFSARPPGGPAAELVSEVSAAHELPIAGVAGVRVHGERGSLTLHLPMIRDNPTPDDLFHILSAHLEGDQLVVEVTYGGGCRRHDFRALWNGALRKSNPPQLSLVLTHDGHDDPCRAVVHQTLRIDMFDLPPAVVLLQNGFGYEASFRYRLSSPA